ncbi:MAG: hypothetical protein ACP5GU_00420 [Thermoprotei archaeon]
MTENESLNLQGMENVIENFFNIMSIIETGNMENKLVADQFSHK